MAEGVIVTEPDPPASGKSWLDDKLKTLSALYDRYGREGLRSQSLTDVNLLLASKELALRDAAKGRELDDVRKAENRQLELEIKDLTGFVNCQLAGANLPAVRHSRTQFTPQQTSPQAKPKGRDIDMDR